MNALAAIHVAKKQLGLDDDTYRAVLVRVTGKDSAKEMTQAERDRVVQELRRQGFKRSSSAGRKPLEGKFARKLQALWIAGWNLGVVRERDDKALVAFVERQTGLSHVRFLHDAGDAMKAIEALKGWLERAGVNWSTGSDRPAWLRQPGAQIAVAPWNILVAKEAAPGDIRWFRDFVADLALPVDQMANGDWVPVMNALGERVRKVKK